MTRIFLNQQTPISAGFGKSKTGDTVTITLVDVAGNAIGSGFSVTSVVELGDGNYGAGITFTSATEGFIKFAATTAAFSLYAPFIAEARPEPQIKKNTALTDFEFLVTDDTNHSPATGKTVTATRSIDGAAFASCANSVTEVSNGIYKIDLAAADLNGDVVTLRFTAPDCDDVLITIVTQDY